MLDPWVRMGEPCPIFLPCSVRGDRPPSSVEGSKKNHFHPQGEPQYLPQAPICLISFVP